MSNPDLEIILSDMKPHRVKIIDDSSISSGWAVDIKPFVGKEILIQKEIGNNDCYWLYALSGDRIGDHHWITQLKYYELKENFMDEEFL